MEVLQTLECEDRLRSLDSRREKSSTAQLLNLRRRGFTTAVLDTNHMDTIGMNEGGQTPLLVGKTVRTLFVGVAKLEDGTQLE